MEGDPAQHWLGWQFFRNSPLLQWPIGANPDFGMEIGSSIVFTDSLPLLAFIFKPLNALLPDKFQYTGLWILICFCLQSFFAWKLLATFTRDKWLPLIGSIFFTVAPVYLWRLHGHYALFGQWVLLAGFYFYFAKNFSIFLWMALLAAVALIHAYLLAMVLAIYVADLIQRCWLKQTGIVKTLSYFFAAIIFIAIMMWTAGYFMLGGGVGTGGFGIYRMNLLSLIDPDDIWSKLLPDQKGGIGDYEGFNYLGLGILGLGLIAAYELVRNIKKSLKAKISPVLTPIIILCIGFFLYAISNLVAFGPNEIFSYNLPPKTVLLTNTFRVSGRFFWPVYYVIYLAIFYVLFTRLKRSTAITLCLVTLLVQVIDTFGAWRTFRNKFSHSPMWLSPMRSPVWVDIANQYRKIIFVLPHNSSVNWLPLSQFAVMHRMAINTGYFARVNPEQENEAKVRIGTSILNNDLHPDSLYVFEQDDALWKVASSQILPSDIAGVLDGFRIVAPNLKACRNCNKDAIASITVGSSHDFDNTMERISFTSNGTGQKFQLYGWSSPGPLGTWSDGNTSAVLLPLSGMPKNDLELLLDGHAFLVDKHPSQEVDVLVNNHHVATLKYDQQSNSGVRVIKIPKTLVMEKSGLLLIKFNLKDPMSPAELNLSTDTRRLWFYILSLELRAEN